MLARILARLGYVPSDAAWHDSIHDYLRREIADLRQRLAAADAQILRMQVREAPPGMVPVKSHYRKAKVPAGHFAANARLDDA